MPNKYIGHIVEIIYMSKSGEFSQRKVRVSSVKDGIVRAVDKANGEWRTFVESNILAWQPVEGTA
ncbi:hypothetical protein V7139_31930 [Neobacillus drentensis]|uniref:hypothetical protein n=1 Tax=Neobacillus drentensis TaxID=220684 RepID=UPI00300315DB